MTNAVARIEDPQATRHPANISDALSPFSLFRGAMDLEEAKAQHQLIRKFVADLLVEGIDYGSIPGTERTDPKTGEVIKKRVLYKPGAEHLCQLFRLRPEFKALSVIEDFESGLAFYRYECRLIHVPSGLVVGTGIGSCSSHESKYRWVRSDLKCPECGKAYLLRSRPRQGQPKTGNEGWFCWSNPSKDKHGCGAQFQADDDRITGQQVGKKQREDLPDTFNTVDKMAQKRGLIAATLITCGVSEHFTQDLEPEDDETPSEVGAREKAASGTGTAKNRDEGSPPASPAPTGEPAPEATQENQQPEAGSEFTTSVRGRSEVINLMNRAIAAKICGGTAPKILAEAFEDSGMNVQKLQKTEDVPSLQRAFEKLAWMLAEAKRESKA